MIKIYFSYELIRCRFISLQQEQSGVAVLFQQQNYLITKNQFYCRHHGTCNEKLPAVPT